MSVYFADSWYFLALLNTRDRAHARARRFHLRSVDTLVTTAWVLTEVGDALCAPANRAQFLQLVDTLDRSRAARVLDASSEVFDAGLSLYAQRMDKEWSLTDCISFTVMSGQGIAEALTGDRHFEQAGFKALFVE